MRPIDPASVVDRPARDCAAAVLASFVGGHLTNDEFEDCYPQSEDRAIRVVRARAWGYYDDMFEHRLVGLFALTPFGRAELERCELFLKSSLPFEWPTHPLGPAGAFLGLFLWLPFVKRWLSHRYERAGDFEVWPFFRRADFDRARVELAVPSGG